MSAYSSGYRAASGSWQWPANLPKDSLETSPEADRPSSTTQEQNTAGPNEEHQRSKPERHWQPRTCRICLETVLPTFHPPSEHLAGMFQGGPSVTYDSEDGRLIRPCKCKGSSRYVHESCLQHWRHADPSYGRRNFWQCPTCHFQYRLERMRWGRWITSKGKIDQRINLQLSLNHRESCSHPSLPDNDYILGNRFCTWIHRRPDHQSLLRSLQNHIFDSCA